jgi:hypothetical protein
VARGLNRILGRTYQTQARLNAALEPEFRYAPSGVEAACALGIWLLFYHALLKRLRSCPLPGCGRFHVTYTGRVWNYCSVDHQREGERRKAVERVKRWRIYGKGGGRHARTHRATHEEEP